MSYKKNLIKIINNLSLSEVYTYYQIEKSIESINMKLLHRLMMDLHNEGYITI